MQRAAFLWDQANFFDPGKKVASIVWLGYEAPQFDMPLSLRHTVINTNAAETGAPALASFTDGLHAAHQAGSGVRLTVLGHSYGSTVAGLAARERFSSFADQMILVGSPGVGALAAKDLGVPSVWVGEAPNDPVGDIGSLPLVLTGTLDDATFLPKWTGPLGADPSDREFGAREFYVPDTGDPALTFGAHTKYWGRSKGVWDAQSVPLRNIARLVNGQPNKLIPFPGKP